MNQEQRLDYLLEYLCGEHNKMIEIPREYVQKRALYGHLVNIRPPHVISDGFIKVQDDFLQEEAKQKGIVNLFDIPFLDVGGRISLWQGDITRLEVDAIVNAANSKLLGCFIPGHACVDNVIHTSAGVQLRQACYELMQKQGHDEPMGIAKITHGYNLPSRYVIHTVGPIVHNKLTQEHRYALADCYRSCLKMAVNYKLESIAFCCISTGEFRFPKHDAAEIAIYTVEDFLSRNTTIKQVVLNVFTDRDFAIYCDLLALKLQH